MTMKVKVIHYVNQFFGQVGGEEKADTAPFLKQGPTGPGRLLTNILGREGRSLPRLYAVIIILPAI